MSRLTYTLTVSLLLLVPACSAGADGDAVPEEPSASATPSSEATAAPEPSPSVPTPLTPARGPVSKRCGGPDVPARWVRMPGPNQDRLAAVVVGEGPVTAVYSHQTDPTALCGFWPYAAWLAQEHGIRSVLLDHCGSGGSVCAFDDFYEDRAAQLELAVAWARSHGARRLSLVGASLGGTTAIVTAGRVRPVVDAVIDLSGPVRSLELDSMRSAPRVAAPTLLALDPWDDIATVAEYQRLLGAIASPAKRFVRVRGGGHGWELLGDAFVDPFRPSPLGETVAAWLRGDYVGA